MLADAGASSLVPPDVTAEWRRLMSGAPLPVARPLQSSALPDYRRACPSRIIIGRAQVTTGGLWLYPVQCSSAAQALEWTVAKSYAEIRTLHSTIKKLALQELSLIHI